jgi:hypothetical protein
MDALEGRVVSLRLIFNRKSVRTVRAEPTIFTEIMILRPSTALIGPEPAGTKKFQVHAPVWGKNEDVTRGENRPEKLEPCWRALFFPTGLSFAFPLVGRRARGSSHPLISRVNPSDESLLICKLQEKGGEGIALLPTETREQSLLVLPRHGADFFQGAATGLRQMEGVQTPVVRVGSAFNQSAFREIVQNRHEAAGMNSQPCR